jgi:hypothetical protein
MLISKGLVLIFWNIFVHFGAISGHFLVRTQFTEMMVGIKQGLMIYTIGLVVDKCYGQIGGD